MSENENQPTNGTGESKPATESDAVESPTPVPDAGVAASAPDTASAASVPVPDAGVAASVPAAADSAVPVSDAAVPAPDPATVALALPAPDPAAAVPPPTPMDPATPQPSVKKPRNRGRIAAVTASALLAVAVVAGVGYTVVTVNGADRDAGAAIWKFPETKSADAKKASVKGLPGMLVEYGDGWKRGPDFGQFAADTQLSGAQATALRKESLRGLPRSERRQLEKLIDKQHIEGMAMRSYVKEAGGSFFTDPAVAVNIVLSRMGSRSDVRKISTSQNAFLAGLDIFRKGPAIKGHKEAGCFLPPKGTDKNLDSMFCSAYRGDILITVSADGVKPFDSKGVAELLKDQLDRIAEPGEAV